jgi:hypothetical protein
MMSNYSSKMMNIPSDAPAVYNVYPPLTHAYKIGHRDARHDAAQIASQADMDIELLKKRLLDCVSWMSGREKQIPGMDRICDMARDVLIELENRG